MGDRVQVITSNGQVGYDDIYLFGERVAEISASFVHIEVNSPSGIHHLEMTRDHFIPVHSKTAGGGYGTGKILTRPKDVKVGDTVWTLIADVNVPNEQLETGEVTSVNYELKQGLYNPYTKSGTIVVNGVVASVHSQWFADALFDHFGITEWLPAFYQVALTPVYVLYKALTFVGGPAAAEAFAENSGLVLLGHAYPSLYPVMSAIFLSVLPGIWWARKNSMVLKAKN